MYINSPNVCHIGTRVLVFSGENQVTVRDIMMADVAIFIKNDHFLIVKDRYKEPTKEKFKLFLLADTLNYYYQQIKLRLTEQIGEKQFGKKS